jgi:hypothetical protein
MLVVEDRVVEVVSSCCWWRGPHRDHIFDLWELEAPEPYRALHLLHEHYSVRAGELTISVCLAGSSWPWRLPYMETS